MSNSMKNTKESKYVGGSKRKYQELLEDEADEKGIVIDIILVNSFCERFESFQISNKSSSKSSAESIKEEKEKGFGFCLKKDE